MGPSERTHLIFVNHLIGRARAFHAYAPAMRSTDGGGIDRGRAERRARRRRQRDARRRQRSAR